MIIKTHKIELTDTQSREANKLLQTAKSLVKKNGNANVLIEFLKTRNTTNFTRYLIQIILDSVVKFKAQIKKRKEIMAAQRIKAQKESAKKTHRQKVYKAKRVTQTRTTPYNVTGKIKVIELGQSLSRITMPNVVMQGV